MNDPVWVDLIKQSPLAAALIAAFWMFLKYMREDSESRKEERTQTMDRMQEIVDSLKTHQAEINHKSNEIHLKNTNALERNSDLVAKNLYFLEWNGKAAGK